jgi:hypothetical protein
MTVGGGAFFASEESRRRLVVGGSANVCKLAAQSLIQATERVEVDDG